MKKHRAESFFALVLFGMFAAAFSQNGLCADSSIKARSISSGQTTSGKTLSGKTIRGTAVSGKTISGNKPAGKSGTSEYLCRAENNVKLGRIRAAIDDATKAIEFDPKNWQAYELRALQYFKVGPYQNSIDDFHKAIELAPKELRLREGLVKVVARTGESDFVIDEATRAIKNGFISSFLYQQRADAYYRSEMYENAAKDLTVVLSMPIAKDKWKRWDFLKLRGRCYLRSKQLANAEKDCTEALAIAPDDSKTYFCRADVRDRMGKYQEAIADLNSNIKYDPGNGRAFSMRAKIYEHLGQKQKAEADRKEAIRLGDKQWGI